ncbi:CAP domain-containing protein [Fannyhessea vaginae]|uniref:CAP domain-containing protein n=1 Tax=Fannyhessea vaginae TaxID=82135 RepID=UPI0023F3CD62|nr:CAP domain-containing protein [Fannyhessea vaginae]
MVSCKHFEHVRSRPHASILAAAVTFGLGCSLLFSSPQTALAQNSGWNHDDNSWTYLLSDGTYASGWLKTPNGKWFYFDPESHKMVTGYLDNGDGKSYWLDESKGLVYDEWVKDAQGNWLHTNKEGCLVTGWYRAGDGAWWYFDNNGYAQFGALTQLNKPYYIDYSKGLLYDSWVKDSKGNWLHTDDSGVLATGWFKTKSGYWYYFNQDHTMKTGNVVDKGCTYWLDKNNGLLYNEWAKDESGNWLHTDDNGCLVKGWFYTSNGKWFYFNKDNYKMVTGKVTDKGHDYWLDDNAGLLYDSWAKDTKGNWLHTDDKGCLIKGWLYASNGKLFYFNDDYTMKVGELKQNGKIYTLDVNQGVVAIRAEETSKPEVTPNQPSEPSTPSGTSVDNSAAYQDGAFAFFKAKGATRALEILNKADYASFTHKGNPHDATAVKNMLASIPEMKVCNALRARHGLKPLRVTYELVAMAMSDANWSSSHIAHAQQFNVGENLAWYREKPFTGWYDKEKALYDADPVKNKAAAGHYLNIIDQDYECTGFAIATYANNEYRQPCFGQTFLSETNDSKSMTVDEYERELTQWVKSTQA